MLSTAQTTTVPKIVAYAAGLVGEIVTWDERQWHVNGVEGYDWYVFDQDGRVTIDVDMTPNSSYRLPVVTLVPMGKRMGEGFSVPAKLIEVRRGVCLTKW